MWMGFRVSHDLLSVLSYVSILKLLKSLDSIIAVFVVCMWQNEMRIMKDSCVYYIYTLCIYLYSNLMHMLAYVILLRFWKEYACHFRETKLLLICEFSDTLYVNEI